MYYYGEGVIIDRKMASFWLKQSADQGNIQAKDALNELEK